ncbi:MAG TPA: SUMF1/EgtB/PvdO family nonheme iron enzyme [Polyangiaceae bacterium]
MDSSAPSHVQSARHPKQEPLSGEVIEIPAGAFRAGSTPGEAGRQPELEPRLFEVELGPFQIDRLAYPNDPKQRSLTGVTREQARRLCAARGARLCTELEWERACKGPGSDRYATGDRWDQKCATQPENCASGFDVLGMGAAVREWVTSDIFPYDKSTPARAVVRGASPSAPGDAHRCAQRRGIDPGTQADDLGFRCCQGAPNAAAVAEPELGQIFEKAQLTADRLAKLLASSDETRELAKEVVLFREPDAANTVVQRGPGDTQGFQFTVSPLLWRPVAGAEYLLVAARSGPSTSFVVAYYALGHQQYKLASSYTMKDEPGPVAFGYSASIRPRLHFSTCWGCPGETGKILYRNPDSVIIVQP